ncbi:MAG: leucine-rich repeat protein [Rikenellaceae bacterium]|nr:leucine-rich repeat protein [Rikenellaceae bacterium]
MKRLLLFAAIVCAALFHSCEYDDSDLVNRMDNLENRIKKLEELCTQMNTNISSLQTIVNAIQKNDHISTIAPITKDGKEIGYSIVFTSGKNITIYHGEDGKDGTNGQNGQNGQDGHTPKIGVKQDSDGNYYWTIDGEWLTDDSGNKIKANGTDGKDGDNGTNGNDGQNGENGTDGKNGTDGITPQLKIENEYWYVSYDNGQTWKQLGKATGEDGTNGKDGQDGANGKDGDSFFQEVLEDESNVYFVLADGTILTVAKKTELALYFDTSSLTEITINSEVKVDYTVVSSAEVVDMEVVPTADLRAEVVADDESNKSGHILIRTGSSYDAASKVIVFASDGEKVVMKSISLQFVPDSESAQLYVYNGATKNVPASGGTATLSFLTNVECEAVIPDEASSWISIEPTRALEYKRITLSIAQNTSDRRSAKVKVQSLDGTLSVEYTISQAGTASSSTPGVGDDGTILGTPADNEIFYTSSDGKIIEPHDPNVFGGVLVSNTYENGVGVMVFDRAITEVGQNAFSGKSKLTNIELPDGIISMGYHAFSRCTALTRIVIPNSVTTMNMYVFSGCSKLGTVTLSENLSIIDVGLFENCTSLTHITIPNNVTYIGNPNSTSNIGAFDGCSSLQSVIIGSGVKTISWNSFKKCSSLTNIVIPDNVTLISFSAFENCTALESVVIGSGVKTIGADVFRYCYALNNITCSRTTPPSIKPSTFSTIGSSPKIYVPAGSGEAYKAAQYWSDYADIIEEKEM